jgi:H+/gluconate symporter-like permease
MLPLAHSDVSLILILYGVFLAIPFVAFVGYFILSQYYKSRR